MANWAHKLSIGDLYKKLADEAITYAEAGAKIAQRLETLKAASSDLSYRHKGLLVDICQSFRAVSDVEEFDDAMEELYNWGDAEHACWIDTTRR